MPGLASGSESGAGNVMVARRRGDLWEVGIFMIDRFCLGVKNAAFVSDYDDRDVDDLLEKFFESGYEEKDAAWCRKFVEGAVDYARRLGFAPHGDYKKASRVFGGVKAADCAETFAYGKDGKPFYIQGPFEDQRAAERIMGRLRARCGDNGFHFAVGIGEGEAEDEVYDDDDVDEEWDDEGPATRTIELFCECAGGGGTREAFEEIVDGLREEGMPVEPEILFEPGEHVIADEVEKLAQILLELTERAQKVESDEERRNALRVMVTRLLSEMLMIAAFDKNDRRELLKVSGADENERNLIRSLIEHRGFFARLRYVVRFVPGYRCVIQALRWMPAGKGEDAGLRLHVVYLLLSKKDD